MESYFKNLLNEISDNFNKHIQNFCYGSLSYNVNAIRMCKGNIYFSGVGKCKNIAQHASDMIKSIGFRSFYIDPISSLHGDLGTVNESDLVFLFSKSGNTSELIHFSEHLKNKKCMIIGIFCNKKPKLSKYVDIITNIPFDQEIGGNINVMPTTSCFQFMIYINLVCKLLIRSNDIIMDQYKINHPGGNIGQNLLLKISEIMMLEFPQYEIIKSNQDNASENINKIIINEVLLKMTKYNTGLCIFTKNGLFYGLMSDGDVRKYLSLKKNENGELDHEFINTEPYVIDNSNLKLSEIKDKLKLRYIPVVINKQAVGLLDTHRNLLP